MNVYCIALVAADLYGRCPLVEFTLNLLGGNSLSSLTLRQSPMSVASEQCGMVGTMPTRTTSKDKDHAITQSYDR